MPIKFRCPHCQQFLGIAESKAGTITDCPTCGRSIRIPMPDGSVGVIPPPQLDLNDEGLLAALGALASLQDGHSSTSAPETAEGELHFHPPTIVSDTAPGVLEPVLLPEPTAIAVAHIEDREETPLSTQAVLAELAENALTDSNQHHGLHPQPSSFSGFRLRATLGFTLAAFLFGLMLGLALRGRPNQDSMRKPLDEPNASLKPGGKDDSLLPRQAAKHPPNVILEKKSDANASPARQPGASPSLAETSKNVSVQGTVKYTSSTGEKLADRGARILLLPVKSPGTTRLIGPGLRVGAPEMDRKLMETAARTFGGDLVLADAQGSYATRALLPGQYGFLVASQYQSRSEKVPLSQSCLEFLGRYFERPELVLGNVDYRFVEIKLDDNSITDRDIQFQAD